MRKGHFSAAALNTQFIRVVLAAAWTVLRPAKRSTRAMSICEPSLTVSRGGTVTSWVNSATVACGSLRVWATGRDPASEAGFFALAPLIVLSACWCALGCLKATSEGVGDEE